MTPWPHQERALAEIDQAMDAGRRAVVIQAVTGSGKTNIMMMGMHQWRRENKRVAVYTMRKLLREQLSREFRDCGITHGQRASGEQTKLERDIQLCMIQTERNKVLDLDERELHQADIVLVDEAHLAANGAAAEIIQRHKKDGAFIVGFTATPVGVGHLYDEILHVCTTTEARRCGAILPARCYSIEEPSRNLVRRVASGEEELKGGKIARLYCQMIVGDVEKHWRKFNPDGRPTILFGPDVPSSQWFANELWKKGIDACHIDAKGIFVEGERTEGSVAKSQLISELRAGKRQIVCNRFILREALDIPCLYCCILATRFGSETTYLQAVGRVLRNHESLDGHVVIADHGGNCYDYGSPNIDRYWTLSDVEGSREYEMKWRLKQGEQAEPIVCENCSGMRKSGNHCPFCGHITTSTARFRRVRQASGELRRVWGNKHRHEPVAPKSWQKVWERKYWAAHRNGRTFKQAFCAFGYEALKKINRYHRPDPTWPYMPRFESDHGQLVKDVPARRLVVENTVYAGARSPSAI